MEAQPGEAEQEAPPLLELILELCPEDAEISSADVYRATARLPLENVDWLGFSLQPLGFGINLVLATCHLLQAPGAPEPDDILEAILALPCVQAVKLKRSRFVDESDMDPYDLCWLSPPKPLPSDGVPARCGLVSTFRDAPCLSSWVRFHRAVGFSRIWLYVDAPSADSAEALAVAEEHAGVVSVVPRDEELYKAWEQLAGWKKYGYLVDAVGDHSAVMARQCLNGEHAATLAEAEGITWLLHSDVDELCCPMHAGSDVGTLFGQAEKAGANTIVFPNHEVAPETEGPYPDPFREANLFKVNERLRSPGEGVSRFLAYGNGKSAVRVGGGVRPDGVHKWNLVSPAVLLMNPDDCCLLHFVNCGFDAIARKYEILGNFKDKWFGREISSSTPFHIAARDAAQAGHDALLDLYRQRVMYDDTKATELLSEGALIRVDVPARLLAMA